MKRLLATTMLSLACFGANAEWTLFGSADDSSVTWYTDDSTFKRVGDIIKIWLLADRKEAVESNGTKYVSSRELQEINCAEDTRRETYVDLYSSQMGKGTSIRTYNQPNIQWRPTPPGTMAANLLKFFCAQKAKP